MSALLIVVALPVVAVVVEVLLFMRSSQLSRCEECDEHGAPIDGDCPSPSCPKRRST